MKETWFFNRSMSQSTLKLEIQKDFLWICNFCATSGKQFIMNAKFLQKVLSMSRRFYHKQSIIDAFADTNKNKIASETLNFTLDIVRKASQGPVSKLGNTRGKVYPFGDMLYLRSKSTDSHLVHNIYMLPCENWRKRIATTPTCYFSQF